jgi:hypothetical protein
LGVVCLLFLLIAGTLVPSAASKKKHHPDPAIRVGGPSDLSEPKIAIVGSNDDLAGEPYTIRDSAGVAVGSGELVAAPGSPAPWKHAYAAPLGNVVGGTFVVEVGSLRSEPWTVRADGSLDALRKIVEGIEANRDGSEPSRVHGPSHLNDAVVHPAAQVGADRKIDLTGGWMDAGDQIHFTQTTAFVASLLEAAALLDPGDATLIEQEADVGIRWLVKAHPDAQTFVAQVGDARDHDEGFRDPAADDASGIEGIATRNAYTLPADQIGGDLGGKAAAALAFASRRRNDPALLQAAKEWYAAGVSSGGPAPALASVGYPKYAGDFYNSEKWQDSLAAGAIELYRATGDAAYLTDFKAHLQSPDVEPDGAIQVVDDMASFAAADACGAFGEDPVTDQAALDLACGLLDDNAQIAIDNAHSNAFGQAGAFTWGSTATNGGGGAIAALATAALVDGCGTAAGARDYLLGRNPFGASFIAGYGPNAPTSLHHWAFTATPGGTPDGMVVGGPAPKKQIKSQHFKPSGPFKAFNSKFASYEDRREDYVTSEPAIDYDANSILLLAALAAKC